MEINMQSKGESLLASLLVGKELDYITILRGYVQFNFDKPFINAYQMPRICISGQELGIGDAGYYDRLCGMIGSRVVSVHEVPGISLALNFTGDMSIRISLRPEDRACAEVLMLQDGEGKRWNVW